MAFGGWGGGWMGVGGGWGITPTHMHMHVHSRMHMHARTRARVTHDNFMQMAPPLGESLGIPMMSYVRVCACVCIHVHAYACVGGHPLTTPTPIHPLPTPRGTPGISQNSIAVELIEIFQFCLKIWNLWRLPHPWVVCGLVGGFMLGWVDGWDQVKTLKI